MSCANRHQHYRAAEAWGIASAEGKLLLGMVWVTSGYAAHRIGGR
jgi:hypothetical protein